MTPEREAEIRSLLVSETYLVAMPFSQALPWRLVRELLAALEEARCRGEKLMPEGIIRLPVSELYREEAWRRVMENLDERLRQHGDASYAGPHEALGTIAEEYDEFLDAVRSNDAERVMEEAADIAVGALWTIASLLSIRAMKKAR